MSERAKKGSSVVSPAGIDASVDAGPYRWRLRGAPVLLNEEDIQPTHLSRAFVDRGSSFQPSARAEYCNERERRHSKERDLSKMGAKETVADGVCAPLGPLTSTKTKMPVQNSCVIFKAFGARVSYKGLSEVELEAATAAAAARPFHASAYSPDEIILGHRKPQVFLNSQFVCHYFSNKLCSDSLE